VLRLSGPAAHAAPHAAPCLAQARTLPISCAIAFRGIVTLPARRGAALMGAPALQQRALRA